MANMPIEEHKQRHVELHKAIDELSADYILHNPTAHLAGSILDLIEWSYGQTKDPKEL